MVGVDYLPLMRLQTYLGALVLAALVPLLVFAAIIVRQDVLERQEILERGMQDTAHALSLAIDGEVRSSLAVLETLAGSSFLDHGDLKSFHEVGTRAVSDMPPPKPAQRCTRGRRCANWQGAMDGGPSMMC